MSANRADNNNEGQKEEYTAGELQYLLQAYQEQYSMLTGELEESSDAIIGISGAIEALDSESSVAGKESLMPAGAGLYLYAKAGSSEKVVIGIGGGLLIEADAASAKEMLNKRFEAQKDNMNRISHQMKQVESTMYDISYKMEELAAD